MHVICMVMVTFINGNGVQVDEMRELNGKLIRQTEMSIVADFSWHAKFKEFIGNYSLVTVPKSNCRVDK